MNSALYEPHNYKDPKFPIFFHYDTFAPDQLFLPHWHENWEILYFIRGSATVLLDMQEVPVQAGEVIIVPSNALHQLTPSQEGAEYYCLIIDRVFCAEHGFNTEEIFFQTKVKDPVLLTKFAHIIKEFRLSSEFYQSEILAGIISVLVYLARNYSVPASLPLNKTQTAKLDIVKRAFAYVDAHYAEPLSIDDLAECTGFSKYYFCHVFKDVTGMPPSAYINFIRCRHARKLLASGKCGVSEAALRCGYENLSYFSKIYKKYIGELPSKTAK